MKGRDGCWKRGWQCFSDSEFTRGFDSFDLLISRISKWIRLWIKNVLWIVFLFLISPKRKILRIVVILIIILLKELRWWFFYFMIILLLPIKKLGFMFYLYLWKIIWVFDPDNSLHLKKKKKKSRFDLYRKNDILVYVKGLIGILMSTLHFFLNKTKSLC